MKLRSALVCSPQAESRFLLLQGRLIGEPEVGPFVMNHRAEMIQALAETTK